ncbi:arylsulfatase I-like isoform X2 [Betta splendens]|uniref:Arylsulfatase I-like isoform X2 n=1 Tax=Betta splendens TaxID=158456 RepID=A0A6P7KZT0_BETSP|nr:arylsulfatase I-like isoform X2 [Betta splendens]
MQTPLILLSVFCCLSAQSKRNQNRTNHEEPGRRKPPHIIFILTDDQGFNDIGYHNPSIRTPTLDKLAAEGVTLENYYVQPICTPSRSQLLTGRYQIHTGLQHSIIRPRQPSCLPSHLDTLPERLREAGYSTHMVGKWHLGFYRKACLPTRKGFDSFFGSLTGSVDYYSYGSCDGPGLCGYDLHEDEAVAWGHEGKYSTLLFTQRARKILQNHDPAERPLFLLLSLQAVHTPLTPPKAYIYPYHTMANVARRKYAAMVSTVDESVRNVTYALRKYGFYKNSVIIFSTDNGAQPFTGGSNWPLRGRKGTYWEGGVRGLAFVHSPLLRRRRRVSRALLHITDWFPTLVGLAGGDSSKSPGLDGFDVWPAISEGKESPRQEILHNINPLHKPTAPGAKGASVHKSSQKKKKKKTLKQQPKQKSAFQLKTARKQKVKKKPKRKLVLKPKPGSKTRTKVRAASPRQLYRPRRIVSRCRSKRRHASRSESSRTPVHSTSQPGSAHPPLTPPSSQSVPDPSSQSVPDPSSQSVPDRSFQSVWDPSSQSVWDPSSQSVWDPSSQSVPDPSSQSVWDTSVQAAIRVGDWKLLTGDPGHGDWVPLQLLPSLPGRWWNLERTFSPSTHKTVWLFNITADPCERHDLAEQNPHVVRRLLARLAHYNQTAVPVYFPPDDPRADPGRHGGAWVPWVEEGEGEGEEGKYRGVYKKSRNSRKRKKPRCQLCKLNAFFLKLNTRMMSNRI